MFFFVIDSWELIIIYGQKVLSAKINQQQQLKKLNLSSTAVILQKTLKTMNYCSGMWLKILFYCISKKGNVYLCQTIWDNKLPFLYKSEYTKLLESCENKEKFIFLHEPTMLSFYLSPHWQWRHILCCEGSILLANVMLLDTTTAITAILF